MNTTHSPLPWISIRQDFRSLIATPDAPKVAIAEVFHVEPESPADNHWLKAGEEGLANAQFIVTACNSHAALLGALETLQSVVRAVDSPVVFPGWEERRQEALRQARQALALAKGETK